MPTSQTLNVNWVFKSATILLVSQTAGMTYSQLQEHTIIMQIIILIKIMIVIITIIIMIIIVHVIVARTRNVF